MLNREQIALLKLVRSSLWSKEEAVTEVDWDMVEKYAQDQGVMWMAYLGAKKCTHSIPSDKMKSWRLVLHSGVVYNDQINSVQKDIVEWLLDHNIRVAILKGTSCSRYYPYPELRPLGDIDILLDKENMGIVGKYLEEQGYYPSRDAHSFHAAYHRNGIIIELHYAATEVPSSNGGKVVEDEMDRFLDCIYMAESESLTFPVLSDAYQALMLLLHMERHMVQDGLGLRQLCDWVVFVNGSTKSHWKEGTLELLRRCGLQVYAKVLTKTCVDYLGLKPCNAEWCLDIGDDLSQAMIEDIFHNGNMGSADEESMGSLFTERQIFGRKGQNKLTGLISKLIRLSYDNFPLARKYKIFVPIICLYIPLRYMIRSIRGYRTHKSVSTVIEIANKRQKLYKALHLYEI